MIVCGWCGHPTKPDRCSVCNHEDPARPWVQRGEEAPVVRTDAAGRPALDVRSTRKRLNDAHAALGGDPTAEALAEYLGISTRTLGRWQKVAG